MGKTIITKRDLDALIHMHILHSSSNECAQVTPLPVVWRARGRNDCNWAIPGWTGDSEAVRRCVDRLHHQLRGLRVLYDIPEEQ
jgi:hypothetical protein